MFTSMFIYMHTNIHTHTCVHACIAHAYTFKYKDTHLPAAGPRSQSNRGGLSERVCARMGVERRGPPAPDDNSEDKIQKQNTSGRTNPLAAPLLAHLLHLPLPRSPADTTCGFQHFLRTRPTGSLFPRDTRSTPCLSRGARRTRACTRRRKCTSTEGSTPSAILGDTYSPCPLHQSSSASCSWFPSGG